MSEHSEETFPEVRRRVKSDAASSPKSVGPLFDGVIENESIELKLPSRPEAYLVSVIIKFELFTVLPIIIGLFACIWLIGFLLDMFVQKTR